MMQELKKQMKGRARLIGSIYAVVAAGISLAVATIILFMALGPVVRAANNSVQIIFADSGTGSGTFVNPSTGQNTSTPFGFWVWCEDPDSSNPYHGRCNGAMYFYAFSITKHVDGTVSEIATDTYMMSVASSDGAVNCALTNAPPIKKGRANTVSVVCSAPSGSGADTKAVVNVTGP